VDLAGRQREPGLVFSARWQISPVSSNVGMYFGEVSDMIQPSFAIGMNTPNSMARTS